MLPEHTLSTFKERGDHTKGSQLEAMLLPKDLSQEGASKERWETTQQLHGHVWKVHQGRVGLC